MTCDHIQCYELQSTGTFNAKFYIRFLLTHKNDKYNNYFYVKQELYIFQFIYEY